MQPADAFSPLHLQFAAEAKTWFDVLFAYATRLFQMLAMIEVGLGAILWMQAQQSGDQIVMGLLRKFLWMGFMYAVLLFADTWIPAVINSFIKAGMEAGNVSLLKPGEVFMQGLALADQLLKNLGSWSLLSNPVATTVALFAGLCLFLSYTFIAVKLSFTLIESYVIVGAGVFLLGFGAFRGTVNIAEKYLSYVISVGIKLLVIYLITGAGMGLAEFWEKLINNAEAMQASSGPLSVAGAAIAFGVVAWMLPSLVASLVHGATGFGLGEMSSAVLMSTRLASAATHGAASLGRVPAHGATSVGQALAHGAASLGRALGYRPTGEGPSREARNAAVPKFGQGGKTP